METHSLLTLISTKGYSMYHYSLESWKNLTWIISFGYVFLMDVYYDLKTIKENLLPIEIEQSKRGPCDFLPHPTFFIGKDFKMCCCVTRVSN